MTFVVVFRCLQNIKKVVLMVFTYCAYQCRFSKSKWSSVVDLSVPVLRPCSTVWLAISVKTQSDILTDVLDANLNHQLKNHGRRRSARVKNQRRTDLRRSGTSETALNLTINWQVLEQLWWRKMKSEGNIILWFRIYRQVVGAICGNLFLAQINVGDFECFRLHLWAKDSNAVRKWDHDYEQVKGTRNIHKQFLRH